MQNASPLLIAGRTGQLARALVVLADQLDLPVVAAGRPKLDLTDGRSIDRILDDCRPRAIVNAAAYTFVDKAEAEIDLAFKINRDGAGYLARAAEQMRIPFIHVSTDYVFDGNKKTPYTEDDRASPQGMYGRSKREGEIAVLNSYSAGVVVRTSWVYSSFGHNFVKTMLNAAQTRDQIQVVDDQYGAPTSAKDLAQAIIEIVEQLDGRTANDLGGIYHLTAAGQTTWYRFAEAIFAGWAGRGRQIPTLKAIRTADYPTPARRPANSQLDCSKAARVFGVRLPHWRQGLATCLDELAIGAMSSQSC